MCAPSPPPAPDYAAAAQAQGAANVDAAKFQGYLNNPNVYNPYGSRTVEFNPVQSRDNFDAQKYLDANPDLQAAGFTTGNIWDQYNTGGGRDIEGRQAFWNENTPSQPTVRETLTPEGQALFDQQQGISKRLGELATGGLDWLGNTIKSPLDTSGASQFNAGPDPAAFSMARQLNDPGGIKQGFDSAGPVATSFDTSGAPGLQGNLDYSGASAMPGADEATRKAVSASILARQRPQLEANRDQLNTQLITRGFRPGTEAWNREMQRLGAQENDMMLAADVAGGQEMQRLFGMGLQSRQQGVNEATTQGNFRNQSRAQAVAEALAKAQFGNQGQAQQFAQNRDASAFENAAQQQRFGQSLSAGNFANAGAEAGFRQAQQAAQFGNQTRAQQIQEALLLRQLPLTELNALRTGAQPVIPQFQNYAGTNVAPAPVFGAAQAQGQADMNAYNQQVAQSNAMMSGLFSLGGAAVGAPVGTFK